MNPKIKSRNALYVLCVLLMAAPIFVLNRSAIRQNLRNMPLVQTLTGKKTTAEQLAKYGPAARTRLVALFNQRGIAYPPASVNLVAIKDQSVVEVYVTGPDGKFKFLKSYPILAASGELGPKLREGDFQVPEGKYQVTPEPNTPFHLALRLNYPNEYDLAQAKEDGRQNPGSDILIHGSECSIGCLAMGDVVIEELFVLACDTNKGRVTPLLICPVDLRKTDAPSFKDAPAWLPTLYSTLKEDMNNYPTPLADITGHSSKSTTAK